MSSAPSSETGEGETTDGRHPTPLTVALIERIRRDGPMPVEAFMAACLQDPVHGYYRSRSAIGAGDDFVTAPEISQAFGELVGLWAAVVWQQMGQPGAVALMELGPGRGTLMADALRATRRVPGFAEAVTVHLVESNATLRAVQAEKLAGAGVRLAHHAELPKRPEGPLIAIGNEFLDVLPVRQVVHDGGRWRVRTVGLDGEGNLAFGIGDSVEPPPAVAALEAVPAEGAILEVAPDLSGVIDRLAGHLASRAPTAALFIDYGHAASGLGDTLQAVRAHRHEDPLASPGEADLTAHVDFAAVGQAASAAGLVADGPITQAEFLGRLGIVERASRLMAANPGRTGEIEAGILRLMAPGGMGTRFKAIGLRSPGLPALPAF